MSVVSSLLANELSIGGEKGRRSGCMRSQYPMSTFKTWLGIKRLKHDGS